jgi:hypothetical protein
MFKPYLILGITSGALSAIFSSIFAYFFNQNLLDFSATLPYWKIISVDVSLSLVASGMYFGLGKLSKKFDKIIFNSLFAFFSITSVLIPITAKLPGLEFPEFYPTFVLPLHLIFSVVFLALNSILFNDEN